MDGNIGADVAYAAASSGKLSWHAAEASDEYIDGDYDGFDLCSDCNDADADVYPGATEVNDGKDNQCPGDPGCGSVDEIGASFGFHNEDDRDELSWTPQEGATDYEVARSTNREFSAGCVMYQTTDSYWVDATPIPWDVCFFYLVRAKQPFTGSWGAASANVDRTWVCP